MKQIKAGDIGLTSIGGLLGFFVMIGQALAQDASKYTHAFIVLDDNTVIAAQPGGARIDSIDLYKNKAIYLQMDLTDVERRDIVKEARKLEGLPYSFLDYLALALARFGIKPQWLIKYITDTGHMICSQMVDEVYRRCNIHLFKDGRLPQDVSPGDLLYVIAKEDDWIE